jgi:hypothetical protein
VATVVIMPKDAERKRWARANARFTINLQRAFGDLLPKLKHAYGQPAGDAADGVDEDSDDAARASRLIQSDCGV